MTSIIRVAVTGVGGGVGQSILKALSLSALPVEVHAVDIQPFSAGLYRAAHAQVLPPLEKGDNAGIWRAWIKDKGIQVLIPGSDHDLTALSRVREAWAADGCAVLVSDAALVDICRDKARTVEALAGFGLPHADSVSDVSLSDARTWAMRRYPFVLKPRDGFASRGVQVIEDEESLAYFFPRTRNPMLQVYLGDRKNPQEFTCSVFVDGGGEVIGTFMARRDLSGGATYRAEVGSGPDIDDLLRRIGRSFRPRGPMNVQLRMTQNGPVPFELNIRCSGTSAIRAHFGFNEPEMLLRHYYLGERLPPAKARQGYAFRYWNEVFLEGVSAHDISLAPQGVMGAVRAWP